ncbi:D-amino-acid oxidase [Hyaloraphidium curvatum]|nr:D-amino-acid oxidase [Hyaloraphidium curvatum]
MSSAPELRVTVLGAGVVGLTTAAVLALHLRRAGRAGKISVVGQSTPSAPHGDRHYTSPYAGANCLSFADDADKAQQRRDSLTYRVARFLGKVPGTHVHEFPALEMRREDSAKGAEIHLPWFKSIYDNFRTLGPAELAPHGATSGFAFDTVCFDCTRYMLFLQRLLEHLGHSVTQIERVGHIADLFSRPSPPDALFVCCGLGATSLGGIEDAAVYPARGQTELVRAPDVKATSGWAGDWYYLIPRGDGTVVVGGTYLVGDWNTEPDPAATKRILENASKLPRALDRPGLGEFEHVRTQVGLRPARTGGTRIAIINPLLDGRRRPVVTNYGHGGYGYQSSWGSAAEAVNLFVGVGGIGGEVTQGSILEGLGEVLKEWEGKSGARL